jgi:hypothetical protein
LPEQKYPGGMSVICRLRDGEILSARLRVSAIDHPYSAYERQMAWTTSDGLTSTMALT